MIFLTVFLGLIFLILIHEIGHFATAKLFKIRVDEFGIGFPPKIIGYKYKGTLYSLNWLPFGGFVRIFGESPLDEANTATEKEQSFAHQPAWKRAIVLSAGVFMNLVAAWFLFSLIFFIGTESFVAIQSVSDNSPAKEAGLKSGDIITGFVSVDEFVAYIDENKGESITLNLKRSGESLEITTTPRLNPPANEGSLGIALAGGGINKTSFPMNFIEGLSTTWFYFKAVFLGFINMIASLFVGVVPEVAGPIGIFSIAYQVGSNGLLFLVNLIAIISINLVILNLLPFPALDGGRLLFLFIEKIKGSPIPKTVEGYANLFGFILLLILMVLVTIKDINTFL